MSWWKGDKNSLIAELATYRAKCELLEKQVESLNNQVSNLQEALIAKTSPSAYASIKAAESEFELPKDDFDEEERKYFNEYIQASEKSMLEVFDNDPEAFIDALSESITPSIATNQIQPGNPES